MSQRRLRERGAAAVEMALVLPLLVLFLGGIIDFGRAFMSEVILTNAAREGARVAQLTTNATQLGQITTRAQAAARVDPTEPAATVVVAPATGCVGATGGQVTVTVSKAFSWTFLKPLPLPTTLTGKSVLGC